MYLLSPRNELPLKMSVNVPTQTLISGNSVRFNVSKKAIQRRNESVTTCNHHHFRSVYRNSVRLNEATTRRYRVRVHFSNGWKNSERDEVIKKRNVVEHISLLTAKADLSVENEKDMLDYLYTLQYQMGGIIAISLGCIPRRNPDGYTHAIYMRFRRKEDLAKYYKSSSYLGVLKDHVTPFCHGLISVDYECDVEDDILPIFRKGEEFNYGVEFILLISVVEDALVDCIEGALDAFAKLTLEFPSLIAQATLGSNFNLSSNQYTHAAVIRFRSSEAFKMFVESSKYKDMWVSKFEPIIKTSLALHFPIEPVGSEIM